MPAWPAVRVPPFSVTGPCRHTAVPLLTPTLGVMLHHLCTAILLVGSIAAYADAAPQVEPKVVSVQTVGNWLSGRTAGRYKVIVTTEGWEHLWSRVFVEWLPDPTDPNADWKALAIAELKPPVTEGLFLLRATTRQSKTGTLIVTLHSTPNRDLSQFGIKKEVFAFEAAGPGVVRMLPPRDGQ
jgi:hypothetical protein